MQADLEYSEVSVDCPGTDVDLISNTQCTVQISTLKADPFSLEHEMPIYAKIVAINTIGESDASDQGTGSSIFVPEVPGAPISLQPTPSEITRTQASFTWSDSTNGGKPILSYKILSDQATGTWIELATGIVSKDYISTGLTQGLTYSFKVEAYNQVGYGTSSAEIAILTAIVP